MYLVLILSLHTYIADVDYISDTINVTFGVGDTSATVCINITDDSIEEGSESFRLVLKRTDDTPDLVEIGNPMNVTGIIDDDDDVPGLCLCVCVSVCYVYCNFW